MKYALFLLFLACCAVFVWAGGIFSRDKAPAVKVLHQKPPPAFDIFPSEIWTTIVDLVESKQDARMLENTLRLSPATFPSAATNDAFQVLVNHKTMRWDVDRGLLTTDQYRAYDKIYPELLLPLQGLFNPRTRKPVVFEIFIAGRQLSKQIIDRVDWSKVKTFVASENDRVDQFPWAKMTVLENMDVQGYSWDGKTPTLNEMSLPPLKSLEILLRNDASARFLEKACKSGVENLNVGFWLQTPFENVAQACAENTKLKRVKLLNAKGDFANTFIQNISPNNVLEDVYLDGDAVSVDLPTGLLKRVKKFKLVQFLTDYRRAVTSMPNLEYLSVSISSNRSPNISALVADVGALEYLTRLEVSLHPDPMKEFLKQLPGLPEQTNLLTYLQFRCFDSLYTHFEDFDFSIFAKFTQLDTLDPEPGFLVAAAKNAEHFPNLRHVVLCLKTYVFPMSLDNEILAISSFPAVSRFTITGLKQERLPDLIDLLKISKYSGMFSVRFPKPLLQDSPLFQAFPRTTTKFLDDAPNRDLFEYTVDLSK